MRSGNRVRKSSPGHTTAASARIVPDEVSIAGGSTARTTVSRRKVTPCASARWRASFGIASRLSTRISWLECNAPTRPSAFNAGTMPSASAGVASRQPSPISVAMKASSTVMASGRRAATTRPRCSTRIPALGAISAQTSRERMARRQQSPRS